MRVPSKKLLSRLFEDLQDKTRIVSMVKASDFNFSVCGDVLRRTGSPNRPTMPDSSFLTRGKVMFHEDPCLDGILVPFLPEASSIFPTKMHRSILRMVAKERS